MPKGKGLGDVLARMGLGSVEPTTTTPTPAPTSSTITPIIGSSPSALPIGPADPNLVDQIRKKIEEKLPPSFVSFRDNLRRLETVLVDEGARYKAAATTIQNGGPIDVIQGAQAMLSALQAEQSAFNTDHQAALQRAVSSQDSVIADLDRQITDAQTQLQQLIAERQAAITALSGKKQEAEQKRQASQAEITKQATAYTAAFTQLQTMVQAEVAKITSYLTGGTK